MDCTAKCRLSRHADVLLSAVTREALQDVQCFVKYFCGNGARVRDSHGRNALHIAASCGRKVVLKWFLEEGVLEVGEKDWESGWTALHRACYYGNLSCALLLLQYGANIYEKDFEGLSPIELLMLDCPWLSSIPSQEGNISGLDVYSWGRNANFTLGHGDDKERNTPEFVDVFARMLHVVICKFHTVFLASNGSVWTCGHGFGGRLGHGHEKTILVPKKIDALGDEVCTGIAAGQDHTVVLCKNGNVFTFGLNKYHQMGHHPPAAQYLTPKLVLTKSLKGKKFIGVAAGKFHTIMYTENEVYSWGLNAGQLGHIKGDRTQIVPRQISGLHFKGTSILSVTCCDAAIVCLTNHGDVYLIYQYTQRKIISKFPNISKLVVTGGRLDDNHFKEMKEKCVPLTIYGLYGHGYVFQWRESDKSLRDCRWTSQKPFAVRDIASGKSLHVVTDHGEVYTEDGTNASVKKPAKIVVRNENIKKTSHVLKQDEIVEIPLIRVRHAHRAVRIISDKYSQNFIVLQDDPSSGCSVGVHVSPPEINSHLRRLFEEVNETFDVEIKVKGKSVFAHQAVLAQGSEKLRTLINEAREKSCDTIHQAPVIDLDEEDFTMINEMIEFLYTGSCASLPTLDAREDSDELSERGLTEDELLNELALSLQNVDFDLLDVPWHPVCPEETKQGKKSLRSQKKGKCGEKTDCGSTKKETCSGEVSLRRKDLLRVAKKYRVGELVSRLQDSADDFGMRQKRFHRSKLSEYCDVVIEADDGEEFCCHKCILVTRLEYFSMMLTTGWMESSGDFVCLKMPIPSRVLKVIIEFLYTDEAPSVKESKDLEFLGKVLTVADQLWIIRLREMCEATLASLISLKNASEMLEFSCLYNAEKLKSVCLEFICMNISCLFEAGSLEMLSEDVLDEVSKVYRQTIPRMSWRVITPSDIHLSVPCPQPETPSKRKSSRSQRKSRTSESDVTEDRAVLGNGSEINELAGEKIELDEKSPEIEQTNGDNSVLASRRKSTNSNCSQDVFLGDVESEKKTNTGLWYQKHRDDHLVHPNSVRVSTTKKELKKTESNPLPVCSRKSSQPEERQPWGSQSFSPQSSNLRAIMEQEKSERQLDQSRKEAEKSPVSGKSRLSHSSPVSGKSRLSQKERKKMRKSAEEHETFLNDTSESEHGSFDSPTPAVIVNPWNNFPPPSKPSVSFRELLEEEESLGTNGVKTKVKTAVKKNVATVQADEKCRTTSAWQPSNVACSPPSNSYMKFNEIQELQEQETANRERDRKKPLSLIQIEDRAIEQLLEHYGGRYNPCEFVVVERETRAASSPDWLK